MGAMLRYECSAAGALGAGVLVGAGPWPPLGLGAKTSTVTAPATTTIKPAQNHVERVTGFGDEAMEVNVFTTGAQPKTIGITTTGLPP